MELICQRTQLNYESLKHYWIRYSYTRGTDDITILFNFIFTGLHDNEIKPGLSANEQRHRLLLLKTGIHVAPALL